MKRDIDLDHAILQKVESWDEPLHLEDLFPMAGYSEDQIAYNVKKLFEENGIDAESFDEFGVPYRRFSNIELTPKGHDALDAMNDDARMNKFKTFLIKTGKAFTLDLLLAWAKDLVS
ncbi:MAG: DUF2513 domain-containing protein [Desulfobacteraceae bacterium]|nr:DUF2513 domain-containing protein [Desulfobacteraceae bacterium]